VYLNVVAVKTGNESSQWAKDLAAAYRSPEFKAVVDSQFPATPSLLPEVIRLRLKMPRAAMRSFSCLWIGWL
jgi:hypothetical protein